MGSFLRTFAAAAVLIASWIAVMLSAALAASFVVPAAIWIGRCSRARCLVFFGAVARTPSRERKGRSRKGAAQRCSLQREQRNDEKPFAAAGRRSQQATKDTSHLALFFVLASPLLAIPILSAGRAAQRYYEGTATLRTFGLPGPEFYNLDPQLRLKRVTLGCLVAGWSELHLVPHNATIELLVRTFGPMRGAYLGPYPDRREAERLLEARGDEMTIAQLEREGVELERGYSVRLPERALSALRRIDPNVVRVAIAGSRAIVAGGGKPGGIVLIDGVTGEEFASYQP